MENHLTDVRGISEMREGTGEPPPKFAASRRLAATEDSGNDLGHVDDRGCFAASEYPMQSSTAGRRRTRHACSSTGSEWLETWKAGGEIAIHIADMTASVIELDEQ